MIKRREGIRNGQPCVRGIPTWVFGRRAADETIEQIAADYGFDPSEVAEAVAFERRPRMRLVRGIEGVAGALDGWGIWLRDLAESMIPGRVVPCEEWKGDAR